MTSSPTPASTATPRPLYRAAEIRALEAAAGEAPLMRRAGAAAARLAAALSAERDAPVLVLAGPGNNGGDAFVAASGLRAAGHRVHLVFAGDPERLPADAAAARADYLAAGGSEAAGIPPATGWGLIVDGLFGIGLTRPPAGRHADLIAAANLLARQQGCPLLALDVPSGLDADTGVAHAPAITATHTLTFIAGKPGLHTGDGPDHCGTILTDPIGLAAEHLVPAAGHLLATGSFAEHLRPRRRNSHKGSHGSAGILGGAPGMLGAALLAGRAALHLGAGRVFLGLPGPSGNLPGVDPAQPELMLRPAARLFEAPLTALAAGPGLGRSAEATAQIEMALRGPLPLLLDADALNALAEEGELRVALATREAPTILTPHPAEAARLLDTTVAEVQAARITAALELAGRFSAHVALKGCGTVLATPGQSWSINPTGNPGMASAGMGDVLSGLVVALLAQGWPAGAALAAAVHLHGAAADDCVSAGQGPVGLAASETIGAARARFNAWLATHG